MSGDEVTSPIHVVPHSRAWHLASHSLTFCGFVLWLGGAEPVTSHKSSLFSLSPLYYGNIIALFNKKLDIGSRSVLVQNLTYVLQRCISPPSILSRGL